MAWLGLAWLGLGARIEVEKLLEMLQQLLLLLINK